MNSERRPKSKVWEWPLRVWHWLFAGALTIALVTGLVDEFKNIDIHQWAGISTVALLSFRIAWFVCGGTYAQWRFYWTTPKKIWLHFRGNGVLTPHTAPGIALVVLLMVAALMQSTTGLFMTDDIFFDGPLHGYASDEILDVADAIHHNAWRVILGCIAVHLTAQLIYGVVLRDPTPLGMISGKKTVEMAETSYSVIALAVSCILAATAFGFLVWLSG